MKARSTIAVCIIIDESMDGEMKERKVKSNVTDCIINSKCMLVVDALLMNPYC